MKGSLTWLTGTAAAARIVQAVVAILIGAGAAELTQDPVAVPGDPQLESLCRSLGQVVRPSPLP